MYNNKKIIISMTSWVKRIDFVSRTVYMFLKQTLKPDKIILNLSENEFPNKEKDLPEDLLLLNEINENFEIYWLKENTKAFKKVIPTIQRYFNDNCWILSVDDDWFYDNTYVEFMVKTAENHEKFCLTPGTYGLWPHGYAMIYKPEFFKNKTLFNLNYNEMEKIIASDNWIEASIKSNNISFYKVNDISKHIKLIDRPEKLCKKYGTIKHDIWRRKYIKEKFKKMGYNINFGIFGL